MNDASLMPQSRSSVSAELRWLAFFLAIFAALAYGLLRWLVPHHFNDRVAVMLAAILAGFVMIAIRARFAARPRKG